jgi:hypothetical protein
MSQRGSGPCGLFSRAEEEMKLSDDVTEEVLLDPRQFVELYFTPSAILWAFCRTNSRFKFHKRSELFIRSHNETLSVAAIARFAPFNVCALVPRYR